LEQELTGETVGMLEHLEFGFCDHLSHKENARLGMTAVGRRFGVSYDGVHELMACWVLTQTGTVISQTVQQTMNLEKETNKNKASINEFEIEISRRFKEEQDLMQS
jgi:hypothetical protein